MKFYEKYFGCNYEELITYYPRFYREVFEMVEILKAHGKIADELEDNIERTFLNCFIDYADETTIAKLEKFLQIGLNKSRTLEERRRLVKSFFIGFGKVSASMLAGMIQSYTGAGVKSRFEPCDDERNNMLYLDFQRGNEPTLYMSDINLLLSKKIPAHIKWQAAVTYRFPVGVGIKRTHYRYGYDLCGTKPDIAMIGAIFNKATVTQARASSHITKHSQAAETDELTGTIPDIAAIGSIVAVSGVVGAGVEIYTTEHKTPAERTQEAGKWPDKTLIGKQYAAGNVIGSDIENYIKDHTPTGELPDKAAIGKQHSIGGIIGADKESHINDHTPAGIVPDTAELGGKNKINAGAGASATDYGVDYIYCGTGYSQS